jgi:hypothetical protein
MLIELLEIVDTRSHVSYIGMFGEPGEISSFNFYAVGANPTYFCKRLCRPLNTIPSTMSPGAMITSITATLFIRTLCHKVYQ